MTRGRWYVVGLIVVVVLLAINNVLMGASRKILSSDSAHNEAGSREPSPQVPASQRGDAPELTLKVEPSKQELVLSSLKGKVVVLDFWATWCGPCRESIPELETLYKKYHSQGLEVYGISVDQDASPLPEAVKQLGITYPIVLATDIPGLRDKFEIAGIPKMFVIDKQGRIAATFEGYSPSRDLEAEIKPFLSE